MGNNYTVGKQRRRTLTRIIDTAIDVTLVAMAAWMAIEMFA